MYLFYQIQPGLTEQLPEFIFLVDSSSCRENRGNGGLTRIGKIEKWEEGTEEAAEELINSAESTPQALKRRCLFNC